MPPSPLLPVDEARARILDGAAPLGMEQVPLEEAAGRVLAADLAAERSQPPFDASAMDGYAVRGSDVAAAPATLTVIGVAPAGHGFAGAVGAGEAVRIFTGAPLPGGADTVVIQENARAEGDRVTVLQAARPGAFVRKAGLDFRAGEVLVPAGTRLDARRIGLAAAMNHATLPVRMKPRVALLPTGDELVPPGVAPRPDQIISSNDHALAAFVKAFGGSALRLAIAGDSLAALEAEIARARGCDVLVTLGGASVGEHDLVQEALARRGLELAFWRIAMRPGKPLMFGRLGAMRVIGLPGNPVSALICARIFLKPLMDALLGISAPEALERAVLGAPLRANDERQDYLRAKLVREGSGALVATPFERQDSSMLRTLAEADCLVVRAPHAPAAAEGETVEILRLDF